MSNPIKEVEKRNIRYWYIDGIAEISQGVVFIMIGMLNLISRLQEPGFESVIIAAVLQPALIIGAVFLTRKLVKSFKERYTYQRTGYVAYRRKPAKQRVSRVIFMILIGLTIGAVFSMLSTTTGDLFKGISVGFILALLTAYIAYRAGIERIYVVAGATILWTFVLSYFFPGNENSLAWLLAGTGVAWIVSGLVTLTGYLTRTKPAGEHRE